MTYMAIKGGESCGEGRQLQASRQQRNSRSCHVQSEGVYHAFSRQSRYNVYRAVEIDRVRARVVGAVSSNSWYNYDFIDGTR